MVKREKPYPEWIETMLNEVSTKNLDILNTHPKVAIIVTCYNLGEYLGECLESVLAQTMEDWVCIVVDDGSTDNTAEIARKYTSISKKIHYFFQKNQGLAAARNKGIALTQSDYILPLDADDILDPKYLEAVTSLFEKDPSIKIAYTRVNRFGAIKQEMILEDYSFELILQRNMITATALYRRKDLNLTSGYDPRMRGWEDWEFWISLLNRDDKVAKYSEPLFLYRQRPGSMLNSISSVDAAFNKLYIFIKHAKKYRQLNEYSTVAKYIRKLINYKRRYLKVKMNEMNEKRVVSVKK